MRRSALASKAARLIDSRFPLAAAAHRMDEIYAALLA